MNHINKNRILWHSRRGMLELDLDLGLEIEIKTKICVIVAEKRLSEKLIELEKQIKREKGIFYMIDGSTAMTLITSEKYSTAVKKAISRYVIKKTECLVLITVKSGPEIEGLSGVVGFVYSLFGDAGINIVETMSCWTDTLIIINQEDLSRAMDILKFYKG